LPCYWLEEKGLVAHVQLSEKKDKKLKNQLKEVENKVKKRSAIDGFY
jgi:hypothetical protein